MNKKFMWMFVFLVSLVSVFANSPPYYTDSGGFTKTGNETCDNVANFTGGMTAESGNCVIDATSETGHYNFNLIDATLNSQNYTVGAFWMAVDSCGSNYRAIRTFVNPDSSFTVGWDIMTTDGTQMRIRENSAGSGADITGVIDDGTWQFWQIVQATPNAYVYINGSLVATLDVSAEDEDRVTNITFGIPGGNSCSLRMDNFTSFNGSVYSPALAADVLTFSASDKATGGAISDFTVTLYNSTYSNTSSTSTGILTFSDVGGVMNANITADTYIGSNVTLNISLPQSYEFELYKSNLLNISIYDEITRLNLSNSTVEVISNDFANNYTVTTGFLSLSNLTPGDYRVTVSSSGYDARNYFLELLDQSTNIIDVYLLTSSNSTDVTFTVVDNTGTDLEGALITLKRGYIQSDQTYSYIAVAQEKTNQLGQGKINVDFDNAYYQIFASINDSSVNTVGAKIFSTSVQVAIDLTADPFSATDILENTVTNLSHNNDTETFSYVFSNSAGTSVTGTLDVYLEGANTDTLVCSNSATSSSATVLCAVNTSADPGLYRAVGSITPNNGLGKSVDKITYFSNEYQAALKDILGNQGLFLTVILSGTVAGLFAFSPAIAIIIFVLALVFMVALGFVSNITIGLFITIVLVGGYVAYKLRS